MWHSYPTPCCVKTALQNWNQWAGGKRVFEIWFFCFVFWLFISLFTHSSITYFPLSSTLQAILFNFSSTNPTQVNGSVIAQPVQLKHGDVITIVDRSFRWVKGKNQSFSTQVPQTSLADVCDFSVLLMTSERLRRPLSPLVRNLRSRGCSRDDPLWGSECKELGQEAWPEPHGALFLLSVWWNRVHFSVSVSF